MLKRLFDVVFALFGLVFVSPILILAIVTVWMYDFGSPFYRPVRIGLKGRPFRMLKLRSMVLSADQIGATSTASDDVRITPVGRFIRRFKLDELFQLWSVLSGEMSFVGPRPTLQWEVETYSEEEMKLLNVRPGITNLASIVFSDEGDILRQSADPDADYLRLIRPWKSQLARVTVEHSSIFLDLKIVLLTLIALFSKPRALEGVQEILERAGASEELKRLARRQEPLGGARAITSPTDWLRVAL